MEKKSIKKLALTSLLFGGLALSTLTGCNCNYSLVEFKYDFNKAIIINGNKVTIVEIEKWSDYEGEQLQLITKDGLILVTSSFDTKLVNDKNSEIKAEDIARTIVGEDCEINYLPKEKSLTLTP